MFESKSSKFAVAVLTLGTAVEGLKLARPEPPPSVTSFRRAEQSPEMRGLEEIFHFSRNAAIERVQTAKGAVHIFRETKGTTTTQVVVADSANQKVNDAGEREYTFETVVADENPTYRRIIVGVSALTGEVGSISSVKIPLSSAPNDIRSITGKLLASSNVVSYTYSENREVSPHRDEALAFRDEKINLIRRGGEPTDVTNIKDKRLMAHAIGTIKEIDQRIGEQNLKNGNTSP